MSYEETPPVDETVECSCGHALSWHEGLTGGMCLKSGCDCLEFKECNA